VIDVGDRHQAAREWDLFALQPARIAAAVPLLVVGEGDFLGQTQEGVRPICSAAMAMALRPISAWVRITSNSSRVSLPGLSRILSGMPILPTSCSGAVLNSSSIASGVSAS